MTFKINTICYHRLCTSCIDRIYASGRAPCPIAGCKKKGNANKMNFRVQTFDDLRIERECDIRAKVNAVLNRREEDFESLRAFNDYQEEKEELCWLYINEATEQEAKDKLKKYQVANKESIEENKARDEQEKFLLARKKDELKNKSKQQQQEWEEDIAASKAVRQQSKSTLASIISADDPEKATRQAQARAAQRKDELRREPGPVQEAKPETTTGGGLNFAGIRKKVKVEALPPYDPFQGVQTVSQRYKVKDDYKYQTPREVGRYIEDKSMAAGGFSINTFITRALFEAHSGLGVILGKEKAEQVT